MARATCISSRRVAPACGRCPARALAGAEIERAVIDLGGFDFDQITRVDDDRLLPGALKYGGVTSLVSLCTEGRTTLFGLPAKPATSWAPRPSAGRDRDRRRLAPDSGSRGPAVERCRFSPSACRLTSASYNGPRAPAPSARRRRPAGRLLPGARRWCSSTRTGSGSARSATSTSSCARFSTKSTLGAVVSRPRIRVSVRQLPARLPHAGAARDRRGHARRPARHRRSIPSRLKPFVGLAAALGGLVLAVYAGSHWEDWLLYRHATPFGKADPILGRDVAFYLFELPFLQRLQSLALVALGLATVGVGVLYLSAGSPRPGADAGVLRQAAGARPSVGAGRALADRPGLRRLAGNPRAPHESLTAHPRRDLCRRARTHARAAHPEHRRGAGRAARRLPGLSGAPVADRHRLRAVCGRLAGRPGLRRRPAAVRRRAERAGEGDALHRPQRRRHARRRSRSIAWTNGSCRAMPC